MCAAQRLLSLTGGDFVQHSLRPQCLFDRRRCGKLRPLRCERPTTVRCRSRTPWPPPPARYQRTLHALVILRHKEPAGLQARRCCRLLHTYTSRPRSQAQFRVHLLSKRPSDHSAGDRRVGGGDTAHSAVGGGDGCEGGAEPAGGGDRGKGCPGRGEVAAADADVRPPVRFLTPP